MKFLLNITCDNAAFHGEDCPDGAHECPETEAEIARLLRAIASRADRGLRHFDNRTPNAPDAISGYIDDANGNEVGHWSLEPDSYQP